MLKWIRIMVVLMAAATVGFVLWYCNRIEERDDFSTREAKVKQIEQMIDLCALDLHEEVAVKDSVNGKWIVARQVIEGRVRFDLDSLRIEEKGDTTVVYLPSERVEVMENASPGAYEVYDSWDGTRPLFGRTLTAAEENVLKRRWQKRMEQRIYDRGYVRRARANAVSSLTPLFSAMRGPSGKQGPVIVVDPCPEGFRQPAR